MQPNQIQLFDPEQAEYDSIVTRQDLERRRRMSELLGQETSRVPKIQHPLQGAAYLSQIAAKGLTDWKLNRDERNRNEARAAAWWDSMPEGGLSGMTQEQFTKAALLDPKFGAAMWERAHDEAARQRAAAEKNAHEQSLWERDRAAGVEDYRTKKEIDAEFEPAPERKVIKGADGYQYYRDTGERVLPDVEKKAEPGGDHFEPEQKLRKEYEGLGSVKSFRKQQQAYQRVLDSAKAASPAGDLALIFNYMKILDPGSVVRESEFATAAASGSFGERVKAAYDRVASGKRLSHEMRKDFVGRAGELYRGASELHGGTNTRYRKMAGDYQIDPSRIVFDPVQIGILNPEFNMDALLQAGLIDPEAVQTAPAQETPPPSEGVPPGVDPRAWQYMSPEDRALWK